MIKICNNTILACTLHLADNHEGSNIINGQTYKRGKVKASLKHISYEREVLFREDTYPETSAL